MFTFSVHLVRSFPMSETQSEENRRHQTGCVFTPLDWIHPSAGPVMVLVMTYVGVGVGTTGCSEYLEASNYLKVFTIWKRARFDRITLRFGKGTTKEMTLSSGFILHSCLHNFCIKMPGAVSRETLGNWMASCQP